jgi:hypothetical protein
LLPLVASATSRQVISNFEVRFTKANVRRVVTRCNDLAIREAKPNGSKKGATDRALTFLLLGVAQKRPCARGVPLQLGDVSGHPCHGRGV